MKKITYVIGHKNPDTDSVVSAWAFARLKNLTGCSEYKAARAGKLSPQSEFVFNRFKAQPPVFISDLTPKVEYFMSTDFVTVDEDQSLQAASFLMQKNENRFLIVTDKAGHYKAMLNYSVFARNLINSLNPEHHIRVLTNRKLLLQTLGAINAGSIDLVKDEWEAGECIIITGAASVESLKKTLSERKDQKIILITGDRKDIQLEAIRHGVYCLVISGGRAVETEVVEEAAGNNVCILISPFDTASTSLLTAYSTPVKNVADSELLPLKKGDAVFKIKGHLHKAPDTVLPVVDEDSKICGIISEAMLHHQPSISLTLVDHNEMSQAVDGAENYCIKEIIDHHRINTLATKEPVTFINKVVGATATIIEGLYKEAGVQIDKTTAGLLLSGILSDTLVLRSATATEADFSAAGRLAAIAGVDIEQYGTELLLAGSKNDRRSAEELIRQDLKQYEEGDVKFTVSQIETGSTSSLVSRKEEFLEELSKVRRESTSDFSAILITDITRLDSILLVDGDSFDSLFDFPEIEEHAYFLKGIVSRKKQLIPLLSEMIQNQED